MSEDDSPLVRDSSIVSVLLATVSFGLVAVVFALRAGDVRWPQIALLLFVSSGILFIFAVQAAFWDPHDRGTLGNIARWCRNVGTLGLLAGTAVLLLPPPPISPMAWTVVGAASIGFIIEIVWVGAAVAMQVKGHRSYLDMQRWKSALDKELTRDQIIQIRKHLAAQGIKTGKQAAAASRRQGMPYGTADLEKWNPPPTDPHG